MITIKETLQKNYNLENCIVIKKADYYDVIANNQNYQLYEINNIPKINHQYGLTRKYRKYNNLILNTNNKVVTKIENKFFVLIKSVKLNRNQLLTYINAYQQGDIIDFYWYYSYMKKLKKYSKINNLESVLVEESLPYYLWLLEFSIFFIKEYDGKYRDYGYLSHYHFGIKDFLNPLNISVDIKERDLGEYIKYIFWEDYYMEVNISNIIKENTNCNFDLILARLLYPNYYFERLDLVVCNRESEDILKPYISRINEFESYIKNIIGEMIKIKKIKNNAVLTLFGNTKY